jgi:hypothetical protein
MYFKVSYVQQACPMDIDPFSSGSFILESICLMILLDYWAFCWIKFNMCEVDKVVLGINKLL